jgi:hypothetical protein
MLLNHSVAAVGPVRSLLVRLEQAHVQRGEEVGEGEVGLHPSDAIEGSRSAAAWRVTPKRSKEQNRGNLT